MIPSVIPEAYSSTELQHAMGKDQIPKSDVICNGYNIPLVKWPPKAHLENNGSARKKENQEFLDEEVISLNDAGATSEADEEPWLILPLQVSHPEGRRKRIIVDSSQTLNEFVLERKIKLDQLSKVLPEIPENSWFASLDLSRGYYYLLVREDQRKLLGFRWTFKSGETKTSVWNSAFLGISDLVFFFTKLLHPIIVYCRRHGVILFIYIDDIIVLANSEEECNKKVAFVRSVLKRAGFVEALDKFQKPTQNGVYLGMQLDTKNRRVYTPKEKLQKIEMRITSMLKLDVSTPRQLSKVCGLIVSTILATGQRILMLCRLGFRTIESATEDGEYDKKIDVSHLKSELSTLRNLIPTLQGEPFGGAELKIPVAAIKVASDASTFARAAVHITCSVGLDHKPHEGPCGVGIHFRPFKTGEKAFSSTWKELKSLYDLYVEKISIFAGRWVVHFTDNQAVETIMVKGSPKDHLQEMALTIYQVSKQNGTRSTVVWKSRADPRLVLADDFSRALDLDDWGVDQESF